MENKRRCTTCKEEKPATLDYFYKCRRVRSGLQAVCKTCNSNRQKRYRETCASNRQKRYRETCASNRQKRYREINNAVFNPEMPERKRYINGKVDIVLIYKRKGLLKTMSYPLFLEKYPGEKLETLLIK